MCVGPQGEARIGVPEALADRLDAVPGVEQDRGVEVPQGVAGVVPARLDPAASSAGFEPAAEEINIGGGEAEHLTLAQPEAGRQGEDDAIPLGQRVPDGQELTGLPGYDPARFHPRAAYRPGAARILDDQLVVNRRRKMVDTFT